MSTLKSANVTKYDGGGSGDTIISQGYIKSVEKVWIDSYAFTSALASNDSICIGILPKDAHLIDIRVFTPVFNTEATTATIFLETGATMLYTASSTFFGAMVGMDGVEGFNTGSAATHRLDLSHQDETLPTGSEIKIYMAIVLSNGEATPTGTGTIRSIVKYT